MGEDTPYIAQVSNVSTLATIDQMEKLFGFMGRIRDIRMYPTTSIVQPQFKVCYIKYADSTSVRVALHLTNTVFIDRALVVVAIPGSVIPSEDSTTFDMLNPTSALPGLLPSNFKDVSNDIAAVDGNLVITSVDTNLDILGLPQYPPLSADQDPNTIEEIRRTVFVENISPQVTASQLLDFINNVVGEVKYLRMAGHDKTGQSAYVEFTDRTSIVKALQCDGITLKGGKLKIQHSSTAIVKPARDGDVISEKDNEEAMKRLKEAESLIAKVVEPEIGGKRSRRSSRSRRRSSSRSRRRSRSSSRRRHRRSRSRERRRRSTSRRRRSRSASKAKRSPRRTRSRSKTRRVKRSASRSPKSRSRRSLSKGKRSGRKSRSRSPSRKKVHRSRSRSVTKHRESRTKSPGHKRRSRSRSHVSKSRRSRSRSKGGSSRRDKHSKSSSRKERSRSRSKMSKSKEPSSKTRSSSKEHLKHAEREDILLDTNNSVPEVSSNLIEINPDNKLSEDSQETSQKSNEGEGIALTGFPISSNVIPFLTDKEKSKSKSRSPSREIPRDSLKRSLSKEKPSRHIRRRRTSSSSSSSSRPPSHPRERKSGSRRRSRSPQGSRKHSRRTPSPSMKRRRSPSPRHSKHSRDEKLKSRSRRTPSKSPVRRSKSRSPRRSSTKDRTSD